MELSTFCTLLTPLAPGQSGNPVLITNPRMSKGTAPSINHLLPTDSMWALPVKEFLAYLG